ncbi:MAG: 16S rRNA (cytosine(1402)-N(4))-methyltransferase RsmH [Armatimonadetes bacterium]|nr:16S rRNA (cytosine(1402)-N(4))-methyltransferase RsmH [Armatimonadota bacterium]
MEPSTTLPAGEAYHIPVMFQQTIQMLVGNPHGKFVDGTLGGGGHTAGILQALEPDGCVLAFDADPGAIANAAKRFAAVLPGRLIVRQAYFSEACEMLRNEGMTIDGVLLDLGVSSRQLDSDQIGLSYRQTMPLDMRFRPSQNRRSARQIVNEDSAEAIASLLREFGEEPAAWTIAQAIVRQRRGAAIQTTTDLRNVIASVIPERFMIKTLSRVFQALRIAVNDELGELRVALEQYTGLLNEGGRFAVLTYHSLEDRIVKDAFRYEERDCICPPELPVCRCTKQQRLRILTRKPAVPDPTEIQQNPRARSAKLRVAERVIDRREGREGAN